MSPRDLVVVTLAIAAGAIAKGATGMGLPLVALPVLASILGLRHGIAVMVIPILVTNGWQLFRLRDARIGTGLDFLPGFLACGAVGVGLGTLALSTLPEARLMLLLGLLLLGYVALRLVRPDFAIAPRLARRTGPVVGGAAGILQGATGLSSPIIVTFVHAIRLDRRAHVFAVSAMFLLFAGLQVPALAVAGLLDPAWLLQGCYALLPVAVFMPLGDRLGRRLSRAAFDRLILAFVGIIGAKLALGL